jgi:3-oxoacyl-[acyl-carrier protein] reductase
VSKRLQGKVAIITGAAQGIGFATARKFLSEGASVTVCDMKRESVDAAVDALAPFGDVDGHVVDVTKRDQVDAMVDATKSRHGRIDVLVNNAAMPLRQVVYRISVEQAETALRTNFLSCLWTTWAAIPAMLRQGGGAIVNVSSFASKVVQLRAGVRRMDPVPAQEIEAARERARRGLRLGEG